MILTFTLLLICQLIGEIVVKAVGLPVPGPVLGMVLLMGLLLTSPRIATTMRPTLEEFLRHLSLLFVPAGVGVVGYLDRIGAEGPALFAALLGSTVLTLVVTVLTFVGVAKLTGRSHEEETR